MLDAWPRGRSLAGFPLFRSLNDVQIAALDRQCLWRRFDPDRTVLAYGDPSRDVYFVIAGYVRVLIQASGGKDVILRDIGPGEFFGELAAIDGKPRSASIVATHRCLVAQMAPAVFRGAIHAHPDVCDQILGRLALELRGLANRVNEFSTMTVPRRLIAELLRMARRPADDPNRGVISPPPLHRDLAARIATHREAITKELHRLEKAGVLARDRQRFVIPDIAALEARLNGTG